MVEIELDLQSKSVVAAYVSPELQGLKELLQSTVLGQSIEDIPTPGLPAAGERYFSAYHNVMRSALCMSSAFLGLFGPFFNEYPDISLSS
jgi:hypothetical protein